MPHLKFTHSTIHCCIQGSIKFHCKRVSGLSRISTYAVDYCSQLLNIIQHHFDAIFNRIFDDLQQKEMTIWILSHVTFQNEYSTKN